MPMIHELEVDARRPASEANETLDQRILSSKARTRRRWAIRTALMLLVSAAVLCLFVMWRRDQAAVETFTRSLVPTLAALQGRIDALGWLPAVPPKLQPGYSYVSDGERFFAMSVPEPVIIGASPPLSLFLQADGRLVIIYESGKVRSQWLTLAEFESALLKQQDRMKAFEQERDSRPPVLPR